MVVKAIEDRYPKWEDHKVSTELDNMIQDILKGQLDEKFWEVMAATKSKKRKNIVDPPVVPDTIDVGTSTKRKKDKAHVDGCHASDMVVAHNIAILGLVESVKNLSAKIDGIDVNVADKVSEKLDATIQAKVDAKVGLYEKEMMEKIAMLVEDIKNRKEKAYVNIHTDVANSNDHNSIAQEEDDDSSNALVCFLRLFLFVIFLKIMVPRNVWPTENYGWLCDSHLAAAMLMFHRRSMQSSSPYASRRIAFLDRWFVKSWKWFKDVDSLFLCHNINGNHWVALHIDLLRSTIYVYDCIPDVVKAHKDLQEECRPFTKMIPLILNKMLPPTKGKKSEQQFALRRPKNVPRNDDPGDCGVYSLKYIECLAIGCTFHGLSDEIIPAQRMKLAAEIYEEVAEVDAEGSI
ncbi:hypothetical protein Bca52824_076130 [Brassica carinata]|uniref:Ubiquitin-like protease family profile domain-containing protein n=1 Tax=Brassica carinata TaxID=52824 RepID=A0A8X7TYR3_BRACI|nr:hypothetical protein Bca52824_076130 [Brassica carinata]